MSTRVLEYKLPSGQVLVLEHGDLTEAAVDAIVNAANAQLAHGGGVAGAIVRKGGPSIQAESDAWVDQHGPASHVQPALTGAGKLPARAIIHAVGPVWHGGENGEAGHLRAAYAGALELAHAQGFRSVAFPSISTGIFGYPVEEGAHIALQAARDFCADHPDSPVREIRFTLIDQPTVDVFRTAFERHMQS
jgi:O-acetyl-ADP-ribose deacetylase (regulator of RNase III)